MSRSSGHGGIVAVLHWVLEEAQMVVLAFVGQGLGLGEVPSFEQGFW